MRDTEDRARALFGPVQWDGAAVSEIGQFVLPIGTVTLVLADVQGSTRQWEERPDEMTAALGRANDIVNHARIRKTTICTISVAFRLTATPF